MRLAASVICVLCVVTVAATSAWAGPKWEFGEDSWMQLSILGQAHYRYEDKATDKEDFYLRRGRIIVAGQVCDGIKFFVETDNDNAGKNGSTVSMDVQDAFVDLQIYGSHWMQAGLILLPFSFENRASAASLLGTDYNAETIKFVNTFVWRDYGVEFHGSIGKKLAYRLGAFDGYDAAGSAKNDEAALRYTGHIAVNVLGDVETGWFYTQNRLNKGPYVSVGAGFDQQTDATRSAASQNVSLPMTDDTGAPVTVSAQRAVEQTVQDSSAWVVDIQSGIPFNETVGLTVNGACYGWDNAVFDGITSFVEAGLLVDKFMVTMKCAMQDPDEGDTKMDYTAGLHYFLKGHNTRGGVEYRWGDSNEQALVGLQFLL